MHLLKWEHPPDKRGVSWSATIDIARSEIDELLTESPSLRGVLKEGLAREYERAVRLASKETGLSAENVPEACAFTLEQLIDPEFFPDGRG